MASPKLTLMDVVQRFYAAGKKPPPQLLQMLAQQEALKQPPAALDPVQIASGAYAFGPIAEAANMASGPVLDRLPLSELLGPVGKVPQLIQMAQKGVSGQTRPLSGAMGETQPLLPKGVQMPGGTVQAKGTSLMPGTSIHGGPIMNMPTSHLDLSDAMDMAHNFGPDDLPQATADEAGQLLNILAAPKAAHGIPPDFLEPDKAVTGPLPPQGAVTEKFGQLGKNVIPMSAGQKPGFIPKVVHGVTHEPMQFAPMQPKTEKLTPFEAHENVLHDPTFPGENKLTQGLPGNLATKQAYETGQLNPSEGNRTASLEPDDITEMAGHETPRTEDLINALKQNLKPGDTTLLPENSLYHGLNVFHNRRAPQLAGIANEGMKGGWFSEEPHQPFGPHFVATRPEDLPPLLIRSKQFNVDPEKEIIPRWKRMNTENLFSKMKLKGKSPSLELTPDEVKGRPALRSNWPNIHQLVGADEEGGGTPLKSGGHVVPPEKLFLTNETGQTVGRMAPKSGKNAIQQLTERSRALSNVLAKGTSTVNNVFQQLWGQDPELQNVPQPQKIAKMKQFLKTAPEEGTTLHEVWSKFANVVKAALENAGEEVPK